MDKCDINYKLSEEEKSKFEKALKEIQMDEGYNGWLYVTDDWSLGYCKYCEECGCIVMKYTNTPIPYENTNNEELNELCEEYSDVFFGKAHYIYDDSEQLCHCNDEGYVFNEDSGTWEYDDDCEEYAEEMF